MKKYLFLAALMVIGLSSCSSEYEDAMADDITEADVFVASEQFQEFQQVMQKDDLMMKKKLKKLNKSERNKYLALLDSLIKSNQQKQKMQIVNQINSLLDIDILERYGLLAASINRITSNLPVSKSALIKAIQRYNVKAYTRASSNPSEGKYYECRELCLKQYEYAVLECDCTEWYEPIYSNGYCIYCIMQAEINKEVCDANCEDCL